MKPTKLDIENVKKRQYLLEMYADIDDDNFIERFFDFSSDKMLDKKIKVFEDLKAGKPVRDTPEYYEILELYPKDDDLLWD